MSEPTKAVFLSFAAQDAEFARRIAGALRAKGVEVWLDLGDAAEEKLRVQIDACGLFLPLISANSQTRLSGHFRVEWKVAAERLRTATTGGSFLLPIIIDATLEADARVPADFKTVPWTRMLDGDASPAFCARVQRLLAQQAAAPAALGDLSGTVTVETGSERGGRRRRGFVLASAGVLGVALLAAAYFYWQRSRGAGASERVVAPPPSSVGTSRPVAAAPVASVAPAVVSSGREARGLADEAQRLIDAPNLDAASLRRAESLTQRAVELAPRDAEVLATAAFVAQQLYVFDFQRAPHRLDEARGYATRAAAVAPENFRAQLAVATGYELGGQPEEAARLLRTLAARAPDHARVRRALARAEQQMAELKAKSAAPAALSGPLQKVTGAAAPAVVTPAPTPAARAETPPPALASTPLTADKAAKSARQSERTDAAENASGEKGAAPSAASGDAPPAPAATGAASAAQAAATSGAGAAGGSSGAGRADASSTPNSAASQRSESAVAANAAALAEAAVDENARATSLAVLPFGSEPASAEDEELAEGVSDELREALGRTPRLQVAAQTSAARFKNHVGPIAAVAQRLGVEHVVEGRLARTRGQVRLTARLVRAVDGVVLWEGSAAGNEATIFAAKEQLAQGVVRALKLPWPAGGAVAVNVTADELAAYRLYWAARRAWGARNPAGYARAEELLNRALVLAPRFARAHAALADVWELRGEWDNSVGASGERAGPALARIRAKVAEALALDPASPEALASLGLAQLAGWEFAAAENSLRAALALNPNFATAQQWLGRALLSQGRMDEALVALRRATELDPLAPRLLDNYAWALRLAGRPEVALVYADRALSLQPDAVQTRELKAVLLAELGRKPAAKIPPRAMPDVARIAGGEVDRVLFDPGFDHLRGQPSWTEFILRLGLTEAHARAQSWRAAHPTEGRR